MSQIKECWIREFLQNNSNSEGNSKTTEDIRTSADTKYNCSIRSVSVMTWLLSVSGHNNTEYFTSSNIFLVKIMKGKHEARNLAWIYSQKKKTISQYTLLEVFSLYKAVTTAGSFLKSFSHFSFHSIIFCLHFTFLPLVLSVL